MVPSVQICELGQEGAWIFGVGMEKYIIDDVVNEVTAEASCNDGGSKDDSSLGSNGLDDLY